MFKHIVYRLAVFSLAITPVAGSAHAATKTEDISFVSRADGSEQKYVVLYPESFPEGKVHDILIVLHGAGSDRWQFINDPRDECRAARDVAAEQRMLYVSPDYGAPVSGMNALAEADLIQIIDELRIKYRIGRVIIRGGSMGGGSCLTFAALHPDLVHGVVSINGMANYLEHE